VRGGNPALAVEVVDTTPPGVRALGRCRVGRAWGSGLVPRRFPLRLGAFPPNHAV